MSKNLAVDIGTTTVTVEDTVFLNPQKVFGADVISRIQACNDGHLWELRSLIMNALAPYTRNAERVYVSANTVMLHILAGVSPKPIGLAPYKPVFTDVRRMPIDAHGDGKAKGEYILMPSVGAFIGADVVAGVLSTGMHKESETSMLIDLGTNGETVLKFGNRYIATSAAAGPALESLGIKASEVIGKIAEMVRSGQIDEGGNLVESTSVGATPCRPSPFTQQYIREVQLAKAAIHATIKTLLEVAKITENDVKTVYLAGGIGKGVDPVSAETIGLLPKGFATKTKAVGNSSLAGARLCAKDEANLELCARLAKQIKVVRLERMPLFFNLYTEAMGF